MRGNFLAFSPKWFHQHQTRLLWLLNTPIVRVWFRWVMCINGNRSSVGDGRKITGILPHALLWTGDDGKLYLEPRTHVKFAKRLYFAFKPLWWTLHFWDWVFADRFYPELSFGFLTLTAFPDPDPETTTVDGFVNRASAGGESWATIIAGAGTSNIANGGNITFIYTQADSTTDEWTNNRRSIFLFDTSALTADATISAVVLSLFGSAKTDALSVTPDL